MVITQEFSLKVVTDAMLDRMISTFPHVAAFFYDKDGHEKSNRALEALETIDDDIHDVDGVQLILLHEHFR